MVFREDYPTIPVAGPAVILVEARTSAGPVLAVEPAGRARHPARPARSRCAWTRRSQRSRRRGPLPSGEVTHPDGHLGRGRAGHPLAEALGLPTAQGGRVEVGPDLAVTGHDGIWAIGDVAAAPEPRRERCPSLAPVAMQSGGHVAHQIGRLLEGKPTQPFRFRDKGTMATIGRRSAVAELPGRIHLRGTVAWFAWLGLHLLYLAGLRNRLSVLLNWLWGYLTWDRGPRIILGPDGRDRPRWPRSSARAAARDGAPGAGGPGVVDGAYLVVDQAGGQPTSARCSR